ncbi:hypothetical protein NQ315_014063 [Exocentrus adspersus]|uniref:Uncharacterized protein n=1 Tax=Exocentrus adspersus TaxID=1586481 RepID=A0AAV8VUX9_9CUCU|nr:hypothetical protein NQ315_014063 [Exocentrus adspersus]
MDDFCANILCMIVNCISGHVLFILSNIEKTIDATENSSRAVIQPNTRSRQDVVAAPTTSHNLPMN